MEKISTDEKNANLEMKQLFLGVEMLFYSAFNFISHYKARIRTGQFIKINNMSSQFKSAVLASH